MQFDLLIGRAGLYGLADALHAQDRIHMHFLKLLKAKAIRWVENELDLCHATLSMELTKNRRCMFHHHSRLFAPFVNTWPC